MVFSTVHKAKGLEFNTVKLTDDFNIGQDIVPGVFSENFLHFSSLNLQSKISIKYSG